jgi:hypothetical protein
MKKSKKNRVTCMTIFFVLHCRLRCRITREAAKLAAEFAAIDALDDSLLPHPDSVISDCRLARGHQKRLVSARLQCARRRVKRIILVAF